LQKATILSIVTVSVTDPPNHSNPIVFASPEILTKLVEPGPICRRVQVL
jgi:hypothetical protein